MGVVLAACMCVAKHFPSHASLSSDTRGSKCQSVIAQQQKYITPRSVHTPRLSLTHALTRGAARPTRMCWLSNNPMSELCHTRLCACLTAWMDRSLVLVCQSVPNGFLITGCAGGLWWASRLCTCRTALGKGSLLQQSSCSVHVTKLVFSRTRR